MAKQGEPVIYTIGHSTRPIDEFIHLLQSNAIEELIDIRTAAGSRKNPQFGKANLTESLAGAGISYCHMRELGGLRKTLEKSPNTGWRNDSFRGYADYMLTDSFKEGLADLIQLASHKRVAIMCAEAVPWRCHRNLVADALLVAGATVKHIISDHEPNQHKLCSFAHVDGTNILYE